MVGSKRDAVPAARPHGLISGAWRWGAGVISAGAGLVSILSYTHSIKAKFDPDSVSVSAISAVRWVGISPIVDTARSIGDTIHLAVTATDPRGNALLGAPTLWTSTDSSVASVDSAGTVVARRGGSAGIMVTIGGKIARARVFVRQQPVELQVVGDTMFRVAEGEHGKTMARVVDGRGQEIPGLVAKWRTADPSIAAVDSLGNVTGTAPGRTTFTAAFDGMLAQLPVDVYPVPASLTLLGGDGQRAPAGRKVAQPVMVQVVSRSGRPIEGVAVHFALDEGAGRAEPQSDSSDAQGIARTSWTLGGGPGRQTLAIHADGIANPTVVAAEAEPVAANTRIVVASERLEGIAGGLLAEPVVVRVTDSSGVALTDVPVTWSANDDGSILATASRTDSLGQSEARWTLGPKSGPQQAYVQIGSPRAMPRFVIAAAALPGRAASVTLIGNGKREGAVGKLVQPPVELRVFDAAKNPVAGVAVTVLPDSGSMTDSILTTDSTGRVRLSWTLGRKAGMQRLAARVDGIERAVEISVRARAAGPANLAFVEPKAGTASWAVQSLDADLTDAYGNPVIDQPVFFSTKMGGVSPARVMTDARGRAHTRWTPGSKVGKRTLSAAVKGTDVRATFVLEAPPVATVVKPVAAKVAAPRVAAVKKPGPKRASR